MYKKFVTTVLPSGRTAVDSRENVADADLDRDKAYELHRIGNIARSDRGTRILTVEDTATTLVVIYHHGAVKIYHWVPEVG
jgi:hypothetical protein